MLGWGTDMTNYNMISYYFSMIICEFPKIIYYEKLLQFQTFTNDSEF